MLIPITEYRAYGAGVWLADGVYKPAFGGIATYNGATQFKTDSNNPCYLAYNGVSAWTIYNGANGSGDALYSAPGIDVPLYGWTTVAGTAPAPTFSALSGYSYTRGILTGPFAVMLGPGGAATVANLSWATDNATSASIDQGVGGLTTDPRGVTSGTANVSVAADTVYTLSVTDALGNTVTHPFTVHVHAYRPAPCITGDPVITVCGKALESRCDAPEMITGTPDWTPSAPRFFHTSAIAGAVRMYPRVGVEFLILFDPVRFSLYPITAHGVTGVRGSGVGRNWPGYYPYIANNYQGGEVVPGYDYGDGVDDNQLLDYYNASGKAAGDVLKEELGWVMASPPLPHITATASYPASDGDSVYATYPDVHGTPTRHYLQPSGANTAQTTYGGGQIGYYTVHSIYRVSVPGADLIQNQSATYNNMGMQRSCPYVTVTNSYDNLPSSRGVYAYYCQAEDSMGIYAGVVNYNAFNYYPYSTSYYRGLNVYLGGGNGGKKTDLTRSPNSNLGGPGAHLKNCNKTLEAQLVTVSPSGKRGHNSFFSFDGYLLCVTPMSVSTAMSAETFDPVFFPGGYSGTLPAPIINQDFGDGHFSLRFPVRVTLNAGAAVPGMTVDIRVNFRGLAPDGTDATGLSYSQFSGVVGADGTLADQYADYWVGYPGPGVPDAASWQCTITIPGAAADTIVTNLGGSPSFGKSAYHFVYITQSEIPQPPVVDGNWTCTSPSITLFSIVVTQTGTRRVRSEIDMAQDHASGLITIIRSVAA